MRVDAGEENGEAADGLVTSPAGRSSDGGATKEDLYKTELCRKWSETGTCRYGERCQFAHGEEELREVVRHPLYKTSKCKSFEASGTCKYGSRCRFIHDEDPETLARLPRGQSSAVSPKTPQRPSSVKNEIQNGTPKPVARPGEPRHHHQQQQLHPHHQFDQDEEFARSTQLPSYPSAPANLYELDEARAMGRIQRHMREVVRDDQRRFEGMSRPVSFTTMHDQTAAGFPQQDFFSEKYMQRAMPQASPSQQQQQQHVYANQAPRSFVHLEEVERGQYVEGFGYVIEPPQARSTRYFDAMRGSTSMVNVRSAAGTNNNVQDHHRMFPTSYQDARRMPVASSRYVGFDGVEPPSPRSVPGRRGSDIELRESASSVALSTLESPQYGPTHGMRASRSQIPLEQSMGDLSLASRDGGAEGMGRSLSQPSFKHYQHPLGQAFIGKSPGDGLFAHTEMEPQLQHPPARQAYHQQNQLHPMRSLSSQALSQHDERFQQVQRQQHQQHFAVSHRQMPVNGSFSSPWEERRASSYTNLASTEVRFAEEHQNAFILGEDQGDSAGEDESGFGFFSTLNESDQGHEHGSLY